MCKQVCFLCEQCFRRYGEPFFAAGWSTSICSRSLSCAAAVGRISYIVIRLLRGDAKKIKGSFWVIAALFVAMLLLTH